MNEKWNNWFDKDYYKTDKYSDYNKLLKELESSYSIDDLLGGYKSNDWTTFKPKKDETPQEREARLLREKAKAREAKIDLILKK
jgi:hypothetical protein